MFSEIIEEAGQITQLENMLVLGETKSKQIDYCKLQKYASKIKADCILKPVVLNEFGAWKDRDVIDSETGKYKKNVVSPLNVLHNFTLYKNSKTGKPMYRDTYDFNWADNLVPGKPYAINGPIK